MMVTFSCSAVQDSGTQTEGKCWNSSSRIRECSACWCHTPVRFVLLETDRKVPQSGQLEASLPGETRTYGCCYTGTCCCSQKTLISPVKFSVTLWSEMKLFSQQLYWNPKHNFFVAMLNLSCSSVWHRLHSELWASAYLP